MRNKILDEEEKVRMIYVGKESFLIFYFTNIHILILLSIIF